MASRQNDPKIERLQKIELFASADATALEHLATAADEATIAAGPQLIGEGQSHHEGYVIVSGSVEVSVGGTVVAEVPAGELIGELAMLTRTPTASATVTAKTETAVLVIPYNRFDEILDDNPTLTKAIAKQLAQRLQRMDELYEER